MLIFDKFDFSKAVFIILSKLLVLFQQIANSMTKIGLVGTLLPATYLLRYIWKKMS